jgi:hypothetical protein
LNFGSWSIIFRLFSLPGPTSQPLTASLAPPVNPSLCLPRASACARWPATWRRLAEGRRLGQRGHDRALTPRSFLFPSLSLVQTPPVPLPRPNPSTTCRLSFFPLCRRPRFVAFGEPRPNSSRTQHPLRPLTRFAPRAVPALRRRHDIASRAFAHAAASWARSAAPRGESRLAAGLDSARPGLTSQARPSAPGSARSGGSSNFQRLFFYLIMLQNCKMHSKLCRPPKIMKLVLFVSSMIDLPRKSIVDHVRVLCIEL